MISLPNSSLRCTLQGLHSQRPPGYGVWGVQGNRRLLLGYPPTSTLTPAASNNHIDLQRAGAGLKLGHGCVLASYVSASACCSRFPAPVLSHGGARVESFQKRVHSHCGYIYTGSHHKGRPSRNKGRGLCKKTDSRGETIVLPYRKRRQHTAQLDCMSSPVDEPMTSTCPTLFLLTINCWLMSGPELLDLRHQPQLVVID